MAILGFGAFERKRAYTRGEFGMRGGEGFGDLGRLTAREGANGVDQAATWFECRGHIVEQFELDVCEFLHVFHRRGPTGMRIALPSADAATGGIDQNTVELGFAGPARAAVPEGTS